MNQYIWINENGDKAYYSDKEMKIRHRVDGPAVEYKNGDEQWYRNGKLHREDGPAKVFTDQYRVDGPAVEHINGYKSWYLNGIEYTEQEHALLTKKESTININGKEFTIEELNALIKTAKGNKL